MPRLENWEIVSNNEPFVAPELRNKFIHGKIYDDEKGRFEDGKCVKTSTIKKIDLKEGYAQTRNTRYKLGEPSKRYKKYCEDNNIDLGGK